jgi:cytochrome c-type biogenesis protein CcmH
MSDMPDSSLRAKRSNPAQRPREAGLLRRFAPRNDRLRLIFSAVLLALTPALALAQSQLPPAEYAYTQRPDPKQEADAQKLMQTLRCLVCQGQSIADSDAELAGDMRALVRRRIQAGERPEDIRRWLIERYGSQISYRPPVEPLTWPLWGAPILLLLAGLFLARGRFRKKARG